MSVYEYKLKNSLEKIMYSVRVYVNNIFPIFHLKSFKTIFRQM